MSQESAKSLAIQVLTYLASDPERLSRFLALSGINPASIRISAQETGFLAGVLEHVAGEEKLLIAFAAYAGIDPAEVDRARGALAGRDWEREVP